MRKTAATAIIESLVERRAGAYDAALKLRLEETAARR
jgi:hypothetical protein